jgi:uncharacterized protein GlcG (DUF336 family)
MALCTANLHGLGYFLEAEGAASWGKKMKSELAANLVAEAIAKARADFGRPICVAICDVNGFLIAFSKMDDAPVRSIQISQSKAYTSARMQVDTDAFLERLQRESIPASYFCDDKLTALPGGCVLTNADGVIIGSAGISGLASHEDMAIARALASTAANKLP